jgi:hypothetical protein
VKAWAKALTGPTSLPGKYPQLMNALGCEAGPGSQLVTWGKVDGLLRACVRATRGFDAESLEFVDMIQAGIIDPTKVERVALQFRRYSRSALLRRLGHERVSCGTTSVPLHVGTSPSRSRVPRSSW